MRIATMSQAEAVAIADWTYDGPYAFYDWKADTNDLAELLTSDLRGDRYFSAHDERGELIGFFSFQPKKPTSSSSDSGFGRTSPATASGRATWKAASHLRASAIGPVASG